MKKIIRLGPLGGELLLFILLLSTVVSWAFVAIDEVSPATLDPEANVNGAYQYLPLIQRKPLGPPLILHFAANVDVADPGDTIELYWQTQDAITNTLYHLMPSGQLGTWWNVAPAGTMTYTIPINARNQERFILFAGNEAFPYDSATVSITLTCPDVWFFSPAPDICPQDAALISVGAEQAFERGVMVWVAGLDGIFVLFDDTVFSPKWDYYTDEWNEGDPIDDPTIVPPAGLYQPVRGFGLVWREQPTVRDRLGWALAPEVEFETAVQTTSYSKYNSTYLRALDGNVWWLGPERSSWQKIIVDL
jgi:hypothetical protein